MKSFFLTLIIFCGLCGFVNAQTWTGLVSQNWNDPQNWSPTAVPVSTSNVTINNTGFSPKLQSNVSIGVINVTTGVTLDFNGFIMTINSNVGGYVLFDGVTMINSNAVTDIVLNINTGGFGYYTNIQGCTVNDKITFNISGNDVFYEGSVLDQFNGDVVYNISGPVPIHLSNATATQYSGNFSYTRTIAGANYIFSSAATIGGNFTYQNNVGGPNYIGTSGVTTPIGGTCNIAVNYPPGPDIFSLLYIKNQVIGGTINVQGSRGFNCQNDTLKVSSFIIQNYQANDYGYLLSNKIQGNVTIADHSSYSNGYNTQIYKNEITGNATFTINGNNWFYEGNGGPGYKNIFNGNTVFNINSSANVYISQDDKSSYNGNLTIARAGGGYTRAFNSGAAITGNLSYSNNASGENEIGNLGIPTTVNGTMNININMNVISGFYLHRISNQTAGGKINTYNTRGFHLEADTLIVDSLNLNNYHGNAYARFYNNSVTGQVNMSDSADYTGGYDTGFENNTINGNSSFKIYGPNAFYEANGGAGGNIFNGNVAWSIYGGATVFVSHGDTSQFNGNLSIVRTGAGYTRAFNSGATISGNFVFNNLVGGASDIGNLSNPTNIAGTFNMNMDMTAAGGFSLHRVLNQTAGGKINVRKSNAFNVQSDTLKVDSFNVYAYYGSGYAMFTNNKLTGHFNLSDSSIYGSGYSTHIQNSTIIGNAGFVTNSGNDFFEGTGLPNIFTGNLNINILGPGAVYTSADGKSSVSGNYTVNRTSSGYTRLFANGADIGGNFSYTKNGSNSSDLGLLGSQTIIGGTINITATQTIGDNFSIRNVKNLTNGGNVNIQNIRGMDIQQDSLLVNAFSLTGYGGSAYAYFLSNRITGNVTLQDNAGYTSGYNTSLQNNTINGNTIFNITGFNSFEEANAGSQPNIYNGNVNVNISGSSFVYLSLYAASIYNGNLNVSRTGSGHTNLFNSGATVTGNFIYTKNGGGGSNLGNNSFKTSIAGTVDMNLIQTPSEDFNMYWLVNGTNGGSINVDSFRSFNIYNDSLKVTSFTLNHYGGNSYNYFYTSKVEGDMNISNVATFGGGYHTDVAGNTFTGNSVFTNNGSNIFYDGYATGNNFLGHMTYIRTGGDFHIGINDTNSYGGNLNVNSPFPLNMNLIRFNGSTNGTISQLGAAPINIPYMMLNKTGGGTLTLNSPVRIINTASFENGYMISTLANPLIFLDNALTFNQSDYSHIMGSAIKIGDDAFSFPLGNGSGLHLIGMSAPGGTTDSFQANILLKNPGVDGYPTTSKVGALLHIEPFLYWTLNRLTGSSAVAVSLGWSNPCINEGITDLPSLAVSRWNGSQWTNLGNGGYTGGPLTGTVIQAGTTGNFGPFIIGSTSNLNTWSITTVSGTNSPICAGNSTTLTASGAFSYTWEPGGLSGNSVLVSPAATTTYTVTGISAGGCPTTATKTITVTPGPSVNTTATAVAICTGGSTTITATGATSYTWQPGALSGPSITVSPATTTVYTVTGTTGCSVTATRMITVGACAPCSTNITISTSPYNVLLTESTTFIITSGVVEIDSGAYVKFDAAPASYILLQPGFFAKRGSVFIAQPLNGCSAGSPQKPSNIEGGLVNDLAEGMFVYPNPTTGHITIDHPETVSEAAIFDMMGKKVRQLDLSGTRSDIDIGDLPNGIYILYTKGYTNIKIIKN